MSSTRKERTRLRILDAANELLLTRGYHSVGLEAVADAAGVSRQTVYDQFGSKAGLLSAMITRSEEQAGLPVRLAAVRAEHDGAGMLRALLDTVTAVEPKVYPYSRLVYAARLDDPVAAEMWKWRMGSRRQGMAMVFDRLMAEGAVRSGIAAAEAADIAWAITSPHQYEYLVIERGWSLKRYRAHLETTIADRLLKTPVVARRTQRPPRHSAR
jgi:AcrR family transcriptional regulator